MALALQLGTSIVLAHAASPSPDVTATVTTDSAAVNAGDHMGFTLAITNSATAASTAANVTASDPLPIGNGVADVSWVIDQQTAKSCILTATDGQHPGQELDCLAFSLAPGASYTVHITSTTDGKSCGVYNDTAHVTVPNQGSSPLTANATSVVQCPSDPITVTADSSTVAAGSVVGFTVMLSNDGPGTATGVRVSDPLPPAGVNWAINPAYTGPGTCSITGPAGSQALSCNLGSVAAGGSASVRVTSATAGDTCAPLTDTAAVTSDNAPAASATASITISCGGVLGASTVISVPTTGGGGGLSQPAPALIAAGLSLLAGVRLRRTRR
ncbi:MAG: DUF11 domain-containing protein [Candidatus Dormibacteria bacterium]